MTLFFYKSALCPRCMLAGKYLLEIARKNPDLKIETIDIITAPGRARQQNIRMIPTIIAREQRLAMLWPTKKAIADFLAPLIGYKE